MYGFPDKSLNKVTATLENKKINYILLDRRNNYDVDTVSDNKNLNTYTENYEQAKKYINIKRRILRIYNELNDNIYNKEIKDKISKIEEVLNIGV